MKTIPGLNFGLNSGLNLCLQAVFLPKDLEFLLATNSSSLILCLITLLKVFNALYQEKGIPLHESLITKSLGG